MKSIRPVPALAIFAVIVALVLLPFAVVNIPPLVDFPNHLARCAVLAQLGSQPALRDMYEPRNALLPNLAMDAVVVPLAHLMSVTMAGKVFCGLVLLVMFSGALVLSYAVTRKITLWSFASALFLFNHIFTFGFVNYLFGVGVLLWGMALWVFLRDKPLALRLGVGISLALLLFFSHLVALFLFGCALTGFEVARWWDTPERDRKSLWNSAIQVGSLFVLPAVLLLRSPTHSEASEYHASSLGDKLDTLIGILRINGNRVDQIFTFIVGGSIIALFVTKTLKLEPKMRLALAAVASAFLLLPESFATCGCVDVRIPVVIIFLLAAGTILSAPVTKVAKFAVMALIGAFFLRSGQVYRDWSIARHQTDQVLADLSQLPEKSTVFLAADREAKIFNESGWEPPLVHLPVAAMLTKPLFFPQLFALPTQHPLAIRPELRKLEEFQETNPLEFDDPQNLSDVIANCYEEATDLDDIPPSLGANPHFYVFVITTPGKEEIGRYPNTKLIVRRPRYALLQITNTEAAAKERQAEWRLAERTKAAKHPSLIAQAH